MEHKACPAANPVLRLFVLITEGTRSDRFRRLSGKCPTLFTCQEIAFHTRDGVRRQWPDQVDVLPVGMWVCR